MSPVLGNVSTIGMSHEFPYMVMCLIMRYVGSPLKLGGKKLTPGIFFQS